MSNENKNKQRTKANIWYAGRWTILGGIVLLAVFGIAMGIIHVWGERDHSIGFYRDGQLPFTPIAQEQMDLMAKLFWTDLMITVVWGILWVIIQVILDGIRPNHDLY